MPIALLDPSMPEAPGLEPANLGDCIIIEAINQVLADLFPGEEIVRFPTQRYLNRKELAAAKQCRFIFLGGTNLLCGNIASYNQWKIRSSIVDIVQPPMREVVALGVGWWQYQKSTSLRTKLFYRRVLHTGIRHSVRDEYTRGKLAEVGIDNALNTSCPTLWSLNGVAHGCDVGGPLAFMLTDYYQAPEVDNTLITLLLEHSTEPLLFFPQGQHDVDYICSLARYKANKSRIKLMKRSLDELEKVADISRISYVGTRLHGGIRFLQLGRPALIVAVDNRASEMHHDTGLPVVGRTEFDAIRDWLEGKRRFAPIRVPHDAIHAWKQQFDGL